MRIKNIQVIVEPLQSDKAFSTSFDDQIVPTPKSAHESANYTQLINEIKQLVSADVILTEDFLQVAAPPSGIILLYPQYRGFSFEKILDSCEPEARKSLERRLVLLNISRGEGYRLMDRYALAAIVEDFDYGNWWNIEQWRSPRQRMHGHKAVAEEIEAFIGFTGDQYCQMHGEEFERLPAFLIRYLEAYVKIVPGISELDL